MAWNQETDVLSPVGRPIAEQLAVRPRRQALDGFEPIYSDIVDYIVRCTHRIWEEKNIGLCRTHYADSCLMHTLNGPYQGLDGVVQGTVNALAAYADRIIVGEDVIWSEDAPGTFLSSHRITSRSTHLGVDAMFGEPALRINCATTIADCLVRENLIIEEWLARDNARAAYQMGVDPWDIAAAQLAEDLEGDPARHGWRRQWIEDIRSDPGVMPPKDHPAFVPADALVTAFNEDLYGRAAEAFSPAVEVRWPTGRLGVGRGYWTACLMQLRAMLHGARFRIDHWAARPLPHGDIAVALRWVLIGSHNGHGVWGAPTGRDILVMGMSHYRLRAGVIVEDFTVFDELAVLRQVVGGLDDRPVPSERGNGQ